MSVHRNCYAIGTSSVQLRSRYKRLIFISQHRHLEVIGEDHDALIVSSDWLLWQSRLNASCACAYIDEGIGRWDEAIALANDHIALANSWIYVDGTDVTLFEGVSLGRNLVTSVAALCCDYLRLQRAVAGLIQRYAPKEIVFFDVFQENSSLDAPERFAVVAEIAAERGLSLVDHRDQSTHGDGVIAPSYGHQEDPAEGRLQVLVHRWFAGGFEFAVDLVSRVLGIIRRPKPHVLLLTGFRTTLRLLPRFDRGGITPVWFAPWFPNKTDARAVAGAFARGMLLAASPLTRLSWRERHQIRTVERTLISCWSKPGTGLTAMVRRHVMGRIIKSGRLYRLARDVKRASSVLARYAPRVVLSDSHQNATANIYLQVAKSRGIRTVVTWHSIVTQDLKLENVGANPDVPAWVDRCFTWGCQQERWLQAVGATSQHTRVGYIYGDRERVASTKRGSSDRVLIVQPVLGVAELACPHGAEYNFFVDLVRMLMDREHREIRVKLHPGAPKTVRYRTIIEYFGLTCEVSAEGDFRDHLEWADIVIGPPSTGAMVETIAAYKPYYICYPEPSCVNADYLLEAPRARSATELRQLLDRGEHASDALLNYYTSRREITDPSARIWAELEAAAAEGATERYSLGPENATV